MLVYAYIHVDHVSMKMNIRFEYESVIQKSEYCQYRLCMEVYNLLYTNVVVYRKGHKTPITIFFSLWTCNSHMIMDLNNMEYGTHNHRLILA